jgi:hypothetical protein
MADDVKFNRIACLAQAAYYVTTGIWSLISIGSFQKVTGPKVDLWLVKTVGVLVIGVGATLGLAGYKQRITPEIALLGVSSAAGLAAIDVVYVTKKRISPVYLLDALAEVMLIGLWTAAWHRLHKN